MRRLLSLLLPAAVLLVFACESPKKTGEPCETSGDADECEVTAICGKDSGDKLVCLRACDSQADCADTEECNGVEGSSRKGCRAKK